MEFGSAYCLFYHASNSTKNVCLALIFYSTPFHDRFKNRENSITRSNLYEILRRQLPEENIHLGKNIIDFEQDEASVTIRCSDNTIYRGDILVGADGAYSTIRQNLYKTLRENGTLPESDDASLPYSCVCLTGQTDDLDPSVFPVGFDICQNHCVLGVESMFTVSGPEALF